MAKTKDNNSEDIRQIRDILFGDQAMQFEDRLVEHDNAINALRRENRNLRNALAVEEEMRMQAVSEQGERLSSGQQTDIFELSGILATHLDNVKAQQEQQTKTLLSVVESFQASQETAIDQTIKRLQAEKVERSKQFASLCETLNGQTKTSEASAAQVVTLVADFKAARNGVVEMDSAE